jgi:DNA-binding GntR family transcriptional regulator
MHNEAAEMLREEIFSGGLSPGAFLDEAVLCERLKISRTPLREALKVLCAEGLLRHEPRRGCFVSEVTEQDLDEIFPVIALLEGRCAYEAARNSSDSDIAAMDTLHQRLQEHANTGRITEYYATNFVIHEAIISLANNRWLAQAIADLRKILKLARLQQLRAPGRLSKSLQEHLAIYSALRARNCDAAEMAMRNHLLLQREALRVLARENKSRMLA